MVAAKVEVLVEKYGWVFAVPVMGRTELELDGLEVQYGNEAYEKRGLVVPLDGTDPNPAWTPLVLVVVVSEPDVTVV